MDHLEQSDLCYTSPFLFRLSSGRGPVQNSYNLLAQKMVAFLNHIDITEEKYVNEIYISEIEERVQKAELDGHIENQIEIE